MNNPLLWINASAKPGLTVRSACAFQRVISFLYACESLFSSHPLPPCQLRVLRQADESLTDATSFIYLYVRTLTSAARVRLLIENIPRWGNPVAVPCRQGLNLGMDYGAKAAAAPPLVLAAAPAPAPCPVHEGLLRMSQRWKSVFMQVEQPLLQHAQPVTQKRRSWLFPKGKEREMDGDEC